MLWLTEKRVRVKTKEVGGEKELTFLFPHPTNRPTSDCLLSAEFIPLPKDNQNASYAE